MLYEYVVYCLTLVTVVFVLKKFFGKTTSNKDTIDDSEENGEVNINFQKKDPLAIIGVGCRFPKAKNKTEFWDMLTEGKNGIVDIPSDRWDGDAFFDRDIDRRGKLNVKKGGFIDDIDKFDATFFGITANEANRMDPQQRLLLEVVYHAFEDAGMLLDKDVRGKKIGVFIGISSHDYNEIVSQPSERTFLTGQTIQGNSQSIASNRISYVFDLRGPSFAVDTACSSSVVALNSAFLSLNTGACDMAIVGASSLMIRPETTMMFSKGGFLSTDCVCKSFDANANGYIRSEGVGCVILKPLTKALKNGDRIYTTVLGTLLNQDGKTNGISQPSEEAQVKLIRESYKRIGLDPRKIQFVEAHGTGTKVGDPIEASAIGAVIGEDRKEELYVGSVKSNIGHPEPTSAIAGLIKCCLAMKNGIIPMNLHFKEPNPAINWDEFKMKVADKTIPWKGDKNGDLFSCLNSFGFGGTNGHVVLKMSDRYREKFVPLHQEKGPYLFTLSARSDESLDEMCKRYVAYLGEDNDHSIRDICFSANLKKNQLRRRRLTFVVHSKEELKKHLELYLNKETPLGMCYGKPNKLVEPRFCFVFSGQGPQYFKMGRELLKSEKVFRQAILRCDKELSKHTKGEWSLMSELGKSKETSRINETRIAQPAIFSIQYGLTCLWKSLGVIPQCVVGHSIGEVAASWCCGHLSFEDAVKVIYYRSKSQDRASGKGKMIAVGMEEKEVKELIKKYNGKVCIATINGLNTIVLSGENEAIEEIGKKLTEEDIFNKILEINVPFHSHFMDELKGELISSLKDLQFIKRGMPYYSTVSGDKYQGNCDGEYWFKNVRQTVRFTDGISNIVEKEGILQFVEISNHPILSKYVDEIIKDKGMEKEGIVVQSIRRDKVEKIDMLTSVGRLHVFGVIMDMNKCTEKGNFVDLPLYPFQKTRYWMESKIGEKMRLKPYRYGFPLLEEHTRSVRNEFDHFWTVNLDPLLHPFILHHIVQGEIIYPGAGFTELILQCGLHAFGEKMQFLEDITFLKAMYLPKEGCQKIQFNLNYYDGEFRIYSKNQNNEWDHHVSGKIRHLTSHKFVSKKVDIAEMRRKYIDDKDSGWVPIDVDFMYKTLFDSGLMLGPSFQGVKKLWGCSEEFNEVYSGSTIGYCECDPCIWDECDNFNIHPALLDSAFQSMFGIMFGRDKNSGVYVPINIRKFKMFKSPGKKFWTYGVIDQFSKNRIVASIWIFNTEDELCMEMQGFKCRYIEGTRGLDENVLDTSLFQYKWKQHTDYISPRKSYEYLGDPSVVEKPINELVHTWEKEVKIKEVYNGDFTRDFERLIEAFAFSAMVEFGLDFSRKGAVIVLSEFEKKCELDGVFSKFFILIFKYLVKRGYIADKGAGVYETTGKRFTQNREELLDKFCEEFSERYFGYETQLIRRCLPNLKKVLQGTINAVELLFPSSEWDSIVDYYTFSASFYLYNQIAKHALRKLLKKVPKNKTLHVLEVGAGTGGLTYHLLSEMPANRSRYVFSDISKMFLDKARTRFEEKYPFMVFDDIDLEKDLGKNQKYKPHTFDIIIASNVVHATENIEKTISNIKKLLAPGGYLICLEVVHIEFPSYADFVFGMTKGWWAYNDYELRPQHASLSEEKWKSILTDKLGFSSVASMNFGENDQQTVLIAQNEVFEVKDELVEEKITEGKWIIFGERDKNNRFISDYLRSHIEDHVIVYPHEGKFSIKKAKNTFIELNARNSEHYKEMFSNLTKNNEKIRGIIYLWPICDPKMEINTETIKESFVWTNLGVINMLKHFNEFDLSPELYFITNQVFELLDSDKQINVLGSSVWGYVRSLIHEYSDNLSCLIDLSSQNPSKKELVQLVKVIQGKEKFEVELALREGDRFIHQFQHIQKKDKEEHNIVLVDPTKKRFHAEIEMMGNLDSIQLRSVMENGEREIGDDEVEINVRASGLNFKDVMNGMKLLHEDALVRGYTGPYLGMECTGVVTRKGKKVGNQVNVGDAVMAISADSYSSFVTTKADYVIPKPKHLSFEEAATLPFAYITAYYSLVYIGRVRSEDTVLIHSASGGVGIAAIRICQKLGCKNIICTAGKEEKREYLRKKMGIKQVYDSRSLDFVQQIRENNDGRGVDVILNSLSKEFIYANLQILEAYGRFLELGKTDIYDNNKLPLRPFGNNILFAAIDIDKLLTERQKLCRAILVKCFTKFFSLDTIPSHPFSSFPISRIVDAFQHMSVTKHIGKVVLSVNPKEKVPVYPPSKMTFKKNGTYVISGGTKGLGFEVCKHILRSGGRNVIIFSRSGVTSDKVQGEIERLTKQGVNGEKVSIKAYKADATNLSDLKRIFLDAKNNGLPPIKGVIHSVLVLKDSLVMKQDYDILMEPVTPKCIGAVALQNTLKNEKLDFFVNFSSIATAWGQPGQSNYASANFFLERLSNWQNRTNFFNNEDFYGSALSWGPVGESGFVSRTKKIQDITQGQGWILLLIEYCNEILGFVMGLRNEKESIVAVKAKYDILLRTAQQSEHEKVRNASRMKYFLTSSRTGGGDGSETTGGSDKEFLEIVEDEEKVKEFQEMVQTSLLKYICRISGLEKKQVEMDEPIIYYGFDSMMTNQLRNFIQGEFEVDYSLMKIMKGVSIRKMSTEIIETKKKNVDKLIQQKKKEEDAKLLEEEEIEGEDDDQ